MPSGHAVVDGSNLATEGRSEPSLEQLDQAVRAFIEEYDFAHVTVIVDATFEHRVAKSETKAARQAIDDGDIITPPAGVIGRGDAFILLVAHKADAVVVSNDSFQEFHGTYEWLFDEGRLVGGKPVPGVGWVYVARAPVRGPVSRRATAPKKAAATRKTTKRASTAKKVEKTPRSVKKAAKKTIKDATKKTIKKPVKTPRKKAARATPTTSSRETAPLSGDGSNRPAAWKRFKRDYPLGSTIAATVDRFSSHGAYASIDGVAIYLPNQLLGDPPPTKARDVLDVGETRDFFVHRFVADRCGIDAGLIPSPDTPASKPVRKRAGRKKAAKKTEAKTPAKKSAPKKVAAKKRSRLRRTST